MLHHCGRCFYEYENAVQFVFKIARQIANFIIRNFLTLVNESISPVLI